jgi:hypothetical protein
MRVPTQPGTQLDADGTDNALPGKTVGLSSVSINVLSACDLLDDTLASAGFD